MNYLLHGRHPVRRGPHADDAAADPGPDVARLERGLHRPLELRVGGDGGHPAGGRGENRARRRHRDYVYFRLAPALLPVFVSHKRDFKFSGRVGGIHPGPFIRDMAHGLVYSKGL